MIFEYRITYVLTYSRRGKKAGIITSHLTAKEKVHKGGGWNWYPSVLELQLVLYIIIIITTTSLHPPATLWQWLHSCIFPMGS